MKTIISCYMDMRSAEYAQSLGNGNASKGIREALRRSRLTAHLFEGSAYTGPAAPSAPVDLPEHEQSPAGESEFD